MPAVASSSDRIIEGVLDLSSPRRSKRRRWHPYAGPAAADTLLSMHCKVAGGHH